MKESAHSMTPRQAAQAFYGQDEKAFDLMVAELTKGDPRLSVVFSNTRKRFLSDAGQAGKSEFR